MARGKPVARFLEKDMKVSFAQTSSSFSSTFSSLFFLVILYCVRHTATDTVSRDDILFNLATKTTRG